MDDTGAPNNAEALGEAQKAQEDQVGEGGDWMIGVDGWESDLCWMGVDSDSGNDARAVLQEVIIFW